MCKLNFVHTSYFTEMAMGKYTQVYSILNTIKVIIQTQKCRVYSSYFINGIVFVLSLLYRTQFSLQGSMSRLDSTGKKYFHIVICSTVNFRDSSSLLRKYFSQNFYSQRQLRNAKASRKGFQMQATPAPVRQESDKKPLTLAQNSLRLQRFNF